MRTIVCDIDGTLCEICDDYSCAKPKKEMIDFLNQCYFKGHTIYLYTGRHMNNHKITETWLKKHKVFYHHIFYGKPVGDLYIDDLSITPEEILRRNNGNRL